VKLNFHPHFCLSGEVLYTFTVRLINSDPILNVTVGTRHVHLTLPEVIKSHLINFGIQKITILHYL
jgi:hypothetical protein